MKAKRAPRRKGGRAKAAKGAIDLKKASWVDAIFGSARFVDADLKGDERLRSMVEGARTKPTQRTAKRA